MKQEPSAARQGIPVVHGREEVNRQWISDTDHRWVMVCDQPGCTATSEQFPTQPDLEIFQQRGWFAAQGWGDICPACLASGVVPAAVPYGAS